MTDTRESLRAEMDALCERIYQAGRAAERNAIFERMIAAADPQIAKAAGIVTPKDLEETMAAHPLAGPLRDHEIEDAKEMLDASTLPPLTDKQAKIFRALWQLIDAREETYAKAIGRKAGFETAADGIYALISKGYIEVVEIPGKLVQHRPLASGTPNTEPNKRVGTRVWEDDELRKLRAVGHTGRYDDVSREIGRSTAACEQKSRMMGWHQNPGEGRWPVADMSKLSEDAGKVFDAPSEHRCVTPEVIERVARHIDPPMADDDAADADDLTKTTRDVILALLSAGDEAKLDLILGYTETEDERVPVALSRLSQLKLAINQGGRWSLTELGRKIALDVRDEETA